MLQQQTVQSIQAILNPPTAFQTHIMESDWDLVEKSWDDNSGHVYRDEFLEGEIQLAGGWVKSAYVQAVRNHQQLCNAAMLFAELCKQDSPIRRVILYPREWHLMWPNNSGLDQEPSGGHVETSLRLLQTAKERYNVEIEAVSRIQAARNGMKSHGLKGSKVQSELPADRLRAEAEAYPLTNLFSLTMFSRVIYFQPSGLIINSARLDKLFTLAMESETMGISANLGEEKATPQVLILQPSADAFNKSSSLIQAGEYSEDDFLRSIPSADTASFDHSNFVMETSAIHLMEDHFNLSSLIDTTSYVHISDPGMPGPEFSSSRSQVVRARPESTELRKVWEAIYERYRQKRMEVCGLDLEPDPELIESQPSQRRLKKSRIADENMMILGAG